jgi:hypothetical protein
VAEEASCFPIGAAVKAWGTFTQDEGPGKRTLSLDTDMNISTGWVGFQVAHHIRKRFKSTEFWRRLRGAKFSVADLAGMTAMVQPTGPAALGRMIETVE